jgi:hypothetical protein
MISLVGYAGTTLITLGFLMAMLNQAAGRPRVFLWMNLIGGIALCFPAYASGTVAAHALNGFWIMVAAANLLALYRNQAQTVPSWAFSLYVLLAGVILVLDWQMSTRASLAGFMAIAGVLCFMVGYLELASSMDGKAFRTYLMTSIAGNILYIPVLVEHANHPILVLQVCCLTIACTRLLHDQFRPLPASPTA